MNGLKPGLAERWLRLTSRAWLIPWTLAFGLAYTQAPLFSSNQNQYFLHGLARAGYGYLRSDWLANTVDPTPVFSALVEITYRFLPMAAFYAWALLLFGIYLFSLEGLASELFQLRSDPLKHRLFLALFVAAHAASLRFLLSRGLGASWEYMMEGGLAGQRLLGSVLEPSTFGVFLLLSIYLFYQGRAGWGVVCAVGAASIHPTYLLTAGLLTLAYSVVTFRQGDRARAIGILALALLLVIPILAYVAQNFASSEPANLAQAQDILVRQRIPHHTLIEDWWDASALVQLLLIAAGIVLARRTRLFTIMGVCAGVALVLSLVQLATGDRALALIFPWRPSTILVPLGTTLVFGSLVDRVWRWRERSPDTPRRRRDLVGRVALSLVVLLAVAGALKFRIDLAQKAGDPAAAMMAFVRRSSAPSEVYMVPPYLQDFRLETGAPILVDFKSIPYRAKEVIAWSDRLQLARLFYRERASGVSCRALRDAGARYAVTHVVLEASQFGAPCGPWVERYRDADFAVYEVTLN